MDSFLAFPLQEIPYVVLTLLVAFSVHEFAHAFVAYQFGDATAKNQGRLTLNPLKHLDPIGTLLIFIAGFGWARPVPVNRFYFKRPRLAGVSVSLAGPISNLLLACIAFIVWYAFVRYGIAPQLPEGIATFVDLFIKLNLILFLFNLLPLPPLDGYRVLEDLLPSYLRPRFRRFEAYGGLIFLILVLTPLNRYTIGPLMNHVFPWLFHRLNEFFYQLFMFF